MEYFHCEEVFQLKLEEMLICGQQSTAVFLNLDCFYCQNQVDSAAYLRKGSYVPERDLKFNNYFRYPMMASENMRVIVIFFLC